MLIPDLPEVLAKFRTKILWAVVAILLLVAALCAWTCRRSPSQVALTPAAARKEAVGLTNLGKAEALHEVAQARTPELQAAKAEVARLKAQLAALEASQTMSDPPPTPQEAKQTEVIQAQDRRDDLLEAQLATTTAESEANHVAAQAFQKETESLKAALKPAPTRAAGAIVNPKDQTWGGFYEQDLWRVRVGVDVYQERLPLEAGGHIVWNSHLRVGITF